MNHPWYTASSDASQPDPATELGAIIAAIEDLIMVFDRQGRCLKIAPTNEKLLVKGAAEQIGKSVYENLPTDQADLHFQAIQQTLATQQTSSFEYRVTINEQETWFSAKVSPLSIDTVVMVSRDVTSLKQAEAELRSFLAAMPDVTLVFNDEGRVLKVLAPKNKDLFVAPPHDLVRKTLHESLPVDVADLQLRYTRQCLETQQVISNIEYSLMLNGKEAWFSATVAPLSEHTVIWVARDVSDRKRSESEREQAQIALQQSEQRNRAILDAVPDLMFRLSHDGIYLGYVKPNLLKDLLPPSFNPVGRHVSEYIPSEHAERHMHAAQQVLATGQIQIYEQEVMIGDRLQYEEVRVVASGADEALFMIRDISDRKQAEAALQDSLNQLAAANQEI